MSETLEDVHVSAWMRAAEFQRELIDEYGTRGDYAEGNRQQRILTGGVLEVDGLRADAERKIEQRLDGLDADGQLDREAVRALANVYVQRGAEPLQALDDAAAQVAK